MLRYPDWFSMLDQRRIEQSLADQHRPLVVDSSPRARGGDLPVPVRVGGGCGPRGAAVFETVVKRLHLHCDHHAPTMLQSEAHRLLGDLIAWANVEALDFQAMVHTELRTRSWWLTFLNTVSEPAAATKPRRRESQSVSRRKAEREHVVLPLLDELNRTRLTYALAKALNLRWTQTKWAIEAGVNPHVTIDYLKGTSTPRNVSTLQLPD
jgi:hypothetical protein